MSFLKELRSNEDTHVNINMIGKNNTTTKQSSKSTIITQTWKSFCILTFYDHVKLGHPGSENCLFAEPIDLWKGPVEENRQCSVNETFIFHLHLLGTPTSFPRT